MEQSREYCCACGMVWPCATPGAKHMSTGELEARAKTTERKQQIMSEFRKSSRKRR